MAQLEFTCPDCGSHNLEEIMSDVVVASCITVIVDDEVEYGEQTNSGGVVDRYQCENCGKVIAEDHEALLKSDALKSK